MAPISRALWVCKNKPFACFAKKAGISDADLWRSAHLANEGLIDADLGGGVDKQRIAALAGESAADRGR